VENSQRRPLLDHELLLDVKLPEDVRSDVTANGAEGPINLPFVLLSRLDMMEIVPELIDGELWRDYGDAD
jgi:hypothetical protein